MIEDKHSSSSESRSISRSKSLRECSGELDLNENINNNLINNKFTANSNIGGLNVIDHKAFLNNQSLQAMNDFLLNNQSTGT